MENIVKPNGGVVDVLIVARPNRFRDGLKAVVQALAWVEQVGVIDSWMGVFEYVKQDRPAIVLFDIDDLDPITWSETKALRASCRDTKCIAIIDRAEQRDMAKAMGADAMLLRGFSTDLLYHTMRTMIVAYDPAVPVTGPLSVLRS